MINETKLLSWITKNKFKAELHKMPFIHNVTVVSIDELRKYIHSNKEKVVVKYGINQEGV